MSTYIKSKCREVWQYWNVLISFKIEDLEEVKNEKGYVNLILQKRKEKWKFWETHNLILNEYKKETNEEEEINTDDVPF